MVKHGALTLPKMDSIVDVDESMFSGKIDDVFIYGNIFSIDLMKNKDYPSNIKYEILRVDNVYSKFRSEVDAKIATIENNCVLHIDGYPSAYNNPGDTMLRIDLKITSDNYEDMFTTIYLVAK